MGFILDILNGLWYVGCAWARGQALGIEEPGPSMSQHLERIRR